MIKQEGATNHRTVTPTGDEAVCMMGMGLSLRRSLGTRPSENRKEGLGDRLGSKSVRYRAECMEFVIISSYPLYFWNF